MDISVKGKNLDVGDALRGHAEGNLASAVDKYFSKATDASVVFTHEGREFRTDISVHPGPRGLLVQGRHQSDDPYAAFDALARISKQLRRYKRRLVNHHKGQGQGEDENGLAALQYVIQPDHADEEIATLTVSEAVMRMDLADLPVTMFRDRTTGRLNVVYHRTDGNIGWIDPHDDDGSKG